MLIVFVAIAFYLDDLRDLDEGGKQFCAAAT